MDGHFSMLKGHILASTVGLAENREFSLGSLHRQPRADGRVVGVFSPYRRFAVPLLEVRWLRAFSFPSRERNRGKRLEV